MTLQGVPVELENFLYDVPRTTIVDKIVETCGVDRAETEHLLEIYINEVSVGHGVIAPYLSSGLRILEVGSGLGILSAFLSKQGYSVTSLEPVGKGFDFFSAGRQAVLRHVGAGPDQVLEIGAEELSSSRHGRFDLVFSVHVLEHLDQLDQAFQAMTGVLSPDGVMVHLCPNYAFPYDPHFGIPLVPFRPGLTKHLLPNSIRSTDLWQSLNFIKASRISHLARSHGMQARFTKGQLANMIMRVQEDPIFAQRHSGFAARALAVASALGVDRAVRILPALVDSPMLVELRFQNQPVKPSGTS